MSGSDGGGASASASASAASAAMIVRLCVGGRRFMTTRATLTPSSFLTRLLARDDDGSLPAVRDEAGYIFVDRNGDAFAVVLDYLRTGRLMLPPSGAVSRALVLEELLYFQVECGALETPQRRRDLFAEAVSAELRYQAGFACARKLLSDSRNSTAMQATRQVTSSRFRTVTGSLFTFGELNDLARELNRIAARFELSCELVVEKTGAEPALADYLTIDVQDEAIRLPNAAPITPGDAPPALTPVTASTTAAEPQAAAAGGGSSAAAVSLSSSALSASAPATASAPAAAASSSSSSSSGRTRTRARPSDRGTPPTASSPTAGGSAGDKNRLG